MLEEIFVVIISLLHTHGGEKKWKEGGGDRVEIGYLELKMQFKK